MRKDITKSEAAEILADELYMLRTTCAKADYIMQEVCDNYLYRYSEPSEENMAHMAQDYNRYSALADAAADYIIQIRDTLNQLDASWKKKTSNEKK